MRRTQMLAAFAAAILAGTPPIDEMRREIRSEGKPKKGKDRRKIKAARKQRRKQTR